MSAQRTDNLIVLNEVLPPTLGRRAGEVPRTTYHFIDLPQTTLHYVRCGQGPPLVMVPATVSEIDNWLPLAQLMGRHFSTYFFELPGHGCSTPYADPFSSDLVAETIEAFIDRLGYRKINLLGFSFGGVLALKTLFRLQDRVRRVILIAPAVTHRALSFPYPFKLAVRGWLSLMCRRAACREFANLLQNERMRRLFALAVKEIGGVEREGQLEQRLGEIQDHTYHVLARQMSEVLHLEYPRPAAPFPQPCHFAMSVNDPLLDYQTTLTVVQELFARVHVKSLTMPYHQPPERPTYPELVRDYGLFIEETVCAARAVEPTGASSSPVHRPPDPGCPGPALRSQRCLLAEGAGRS